MLALSPRAVLSRLTACAVAASCHATVVSAAVLPPQEPAPAPCTGSDLGPCLTHSPLGRPLTLRFDQAPLTTNTDHAVVCLATGESFTWASLGLYVPLTQQEGGPLSVQGLGTSCLSLSHFSLRQPGTWRLTLQFNDDSAFFDLDVATPGA